MAKFIIEVDDDFIRENAEIEVVREKMDPKMSGGAMLRAVFDAIAFKSIKDQLDKGVTEFHVTRDMMADDTKREYYDHNITDVLMLAYMANPYAKKEG